MLYYDIKQKEKYIMSKSKGSRGGSSRGSRGPVNAPSKTGNPSGGNRGNNPPSSTGNK